MPHPVEGPLKSKKGPLRPIKGPLDLVRTLLQGLRHADENGGGDGDQAAANPGFSSEATHTKNRKLSGFGPLFS